MVWKLHTPQSLFHSARTLLLFKPSGKPNKHSRDTWTKEIPGKNLVYLPLVRQLCALILSTHARFTGSIRRIFICQPVHRRGKHYQNERTLATLPNTDWRHGSPANPVP